MAFVQDQMVEPHRGGGQPGMFGKERIDRSRCAVEPRQRDVRQERPLLGRQADPDQRMVDLAMQRRDRIVRSEAGP